MSNLYLRSGDDYLNVRRLTISVTDVDGTPVDISTTDLTFMVKRRRDDDDTDALITKTVGDGVEVASPQTGDTKGKAYLSIEAADTEALDGRYRWELEGEDSAGVITLADGSLYITPDLITGT